MDDFKLKNMIINYNNYVRTYLVSDIPSVHPDIRIHLMDENYNLVRYLFLAIYNKRK